MGTRMIREGIKAIIEWVATMVGMAIGGVLVWLFPVVDEPRSPADWLRWQRRQIMTQRLFIAVHRARRRRGL